MIDPTNLPEFDKPPVIEVVCGILFKELASLQAIQLGALWEKLKPEYDHSREVAPLAPAIETFVDPAAIQIQFSDVPPLARTWLLTPNENGIVQVQRDRFLHNWKKVRPEDEYPRYEKVMGLFRDHLNTFEQFLSETDLDPVEPLQYEMTYVNHIPIGDGWTNLNEPGNIFPDFARRTDTNRFLPEPDKVNWRTSFLLPDKQGRLHAVIRNTTRSNDKRPILLLELTARGMPKERSRAAMWSWFDLAHEWIVRGFADLSHENIRRDIWRQSK